LRTRYCARQPLEDDRGRLIIRHGGRDRHKLFRRHIAYRRIGPDARIDVGDTIAHLQIRYTVTERLDDARRLETKARRQRQLVDTSTLIGIDEIEADRRMAHLHLARGR
jgi:hypothetical protein